MSLFAFCPTVELQWVKSQHSKVWGAGEGLHKQCNNKIGWGNRGQEQKHTEKYRFGGIVYIQYWSPDEDDTDQEHDCSMVRLYTVKMKREIHRLILQYCSCNTGNESLTSNILISEGRFTCLLYYGFVIVSEFSCILATWNRSFCPAITNIDLQWHLPLVKCFSSICKSRWCRSINLSISLILFIYLFICYLFASKCHKEHNCDE